MIQSESDPNFKNHSDPIRKNPKAISEGIKHVWSFKWAVLYVSTPKSLDSSPECVYCLESRV